MNEVPARARSATRFLAAMLALTLAMPCAGMAARQPKGEADNGCELQAPTPVLLPHAYRGQHAVPGKENTLLETATLADGTRLQIRHSACVDGVAMQLTLLVPMKLADDASAIRLLRDTVLTLKWNGERAGVAQLLAFLTRAPGLPVRKGARSVCNDGSIADPGACSWESNGGFDLVIERSNSATRISVTASISA